MYLHFGAHGTACIRQSGEIVWKTRLDYSHAQRGPGGSPVLYEDLLIVSCDGQDTQFIVRTSFLVEQSLLASKSPTVSG